MASKEVINIRRGLKNARMLSAAKADKDLTLEQALDIIGENATSTLIRDRIRREFAVAFDNFATSSDRPEKTYRQEALAKIGSLTGFVCRFGLADQVYEENGQEYDHIEVTLEIEYRISVKEVLVADLLFKWVGENELINGLYCVNAEFLMGEEQESVWQRNWMASSTYPNPLNFGPGATEYNISLINMLMFKPHLHFYTLLKALKNFGVDEANLQLFIDVAEEAAQRYLRGQGDIIYHCNSVMNAGLDRFQISASASHHNCAVRTPSVLFVHFDYDVTASNKLLGLFDAFVVIDPASVNIANPTEGAVVIIKNHN